VDDDEISPEHPEVQAAASTIVEALTANEQLVDQLRARLDLAVRIAVVAWILVVILAVVALFFPS
jgi:type VI protein secretion system component VasF